MHRGNRCYFYITHYNSETKKRWRCYAGPTDKYKYVSKLHEMNLKGPLHSDRLTDYLEGIVLELSKHDPMKLPTSRLEKVAERLKHLTQPS